MEDLNNDLIKSLKEELGDVIEITENGQMSNITKGNALIKKMVNEALSGDKTMIINVLKLAEKIAENEEAERQRLQKEDPLSGADWASILTFYKNNQAAINEKIENARKAKFLGFNFEGE